jgi:hypothetical protein
VTYSQVTSCHSYIPVTVRSIAFYRALSNLTNILSNTAPCISTPSQHLKMLMLRSSVLLPEILRQKTDAALPTADSSQPVAAEVDGGHHPAGFPRRIIGKLMPKYLWSYTYYTERWKRTRKRGRMKMRKPLRNPPIPAPVPDSHLEANPPRPSFIYPKKLSGGDEACTIRLLNLHPGRPEDLICCDLQCVSLSETPEYEAISYFHDHQRTCRSIHKISPRGFK